MPQIETLKFKNSPDAALLAFAVLTRLGGGSIDTFEKRLRSQKIQYLAQVFGISPPYRFNFYVRGPYSPDLANDLYSIYRGGLTVEKRFVPQELEERFKAFKKFIEEQSTRQLELLATLHWLIKVAKLPTQEAQKRLARIKGADTEEFRYAIATITKFPDYAAT